MTEGPHWITEEACVDLYIRGRNNRILFRYPSAQRAIADAHLRKLQRVHTKEEKAIFSAARALFDALAPVAECSDAMAKLTVAERNAVNRALASARGEQL